MLKNDPKKFWKVIILKSHTPVTLRNDGDTLVHDDEWVELLNDAFWSIFTHESSEAFFSPLLAIPTPMSGFVFEPAGIAKLVDNLKISSSAGMDNIKAKF